MLIEGTVLVSVQIILHQINMRYISVIGRHYFLQEFSVISFCSPFSHLCVTNAFIQIVG